MGDLGAAAIKAIPALLSLTQDETQHPLIRVLAAAAVAKIDPAQTGAVIPVLISALKSDDAPLQGAAADEQGALGKHAEPALPDLFGLLTDDLLREVNRRPSDLESPEIERLQQYGTEPKARG